MTPADWNTMLDASEAEGLIDADDVDRLAIPTTPVKVNIAAMRQPFHPCTADFIRDVCQARCCRSSTDPTGIAVVVTPREAIALRRHGATVDDETGRVAPVDRRCPFQSAETHLCGLHDTGDKPAGCTISPFTINANGTLIVRNRYRLLPCFKADGAQAVAVAHEHSLAAIFGADAAADIARMAVIGDDDVLEYDAPTAVVEMLQRKNANSKAQR